jgi:hypothetical protein
MIWRVFLKDVLECARCAGRMEIVAVVTSKASITRILDHMGLPRVAPAVHPRARRRKWSCRSMRPGSNPIHPPQTTSILDLKPAPYAELPTRSFM